MTNGILLKETIDKSGVSISFLAKGIGCSRNRIYAIINGADCTATEIIKFSEMLHMSKALRDDIFLPLNVI